MRLVCPNCEAKYEVPEDAIPEAGRDVQCANCGHSWYQMRARAAAVEAAPAVVPAVAAAPAVAEPVAVEEVEAAVETAVGPDPVPEAAEPELEAPDPVAGGEPETVPDTVSAPVSVADPEPEIAVEPVVDFAPTTDPVSEDVAEVSPVAAPAEAVEDTVAEEVEAAQEVPVGAAAAAYAVDDSVLAILREEADREARARHAEAARAIETQTELGIEQVMPVASKVPEVVAEDPALMARRARLPDVEEINSTLRPSEVVSDDGAQNMETMEEGRSSFRSGFLMVMTLAILGAAVYGSADAIADAVPSLAGVLKGYVGFVDSMRLQLDGLMQSATVAINGT